MAPLNSQSRFSMGLARAGPGWGAGGPTLKYPQLGIILVGNGEMFMKTKYKYFAGEIKETFHECLGCGNTREH